MARPSWLPLFFFPLLCQLATPVLSANPVCNLKRDTKTCKAKTRADEYMCLAKQNSLAHLIKCVPPGQKEDRLCQDKFDGIPDIGSPDYFSVKKSEEFCSSPKQVLLAATDFPDCEVCSLRGLLKACPADDPKFWSCLCAWNLQEESLSCLDRCFKSDQAAIAGMAKLRCRHWPKPKPKPARAVRQIRGSSEARKKIDMRKEKKWFTWDKQGTELSEDGYACIKTDDDIKTKTCSIGVAPQPHRWWKDMFGNKLEKCYVHPRLANLGCITQGGRFRLRKLHELTARADDDEFDDDDEEGAWQLAVFDDSLEEVDQNDESRPNPTPQTAKLRTTVTGEMLDLVPPRQRAQG